jgi:hypothetical protein
MNEGGSRKKGTKDAKKERIGIPVTLQLGEQLRDSLSPSL